MQTIGERLEEARKRKGISIREAAETTKIRGDYLQKFEANTFDIDLPPLYIRGFVRTYARFLDLEPERLVSEVDAVLVRDSKPQRREHREPLGRVDFGGEARKPEAGETATAPANGSANDAGIADETAALDPLARGAANTAKAKGQMNDAADAAAKAPAALNDAAHSLLNAARTLLEGKTEVVVAKGQEVYGKVKERAVERFGDTDVLVREKPYVALGVAAAAGFLLGHMISSGRSQVVYLRDAR